MPNVELTENLRETIKDLRKKKKKRGDDLSKELGKGASYISQIENGKIKEIDFELLEGIFRTITDLSEDKFQNYMDNILDSTAFHLTDEELQQEKWMHQFNHEIRMFPINENLISLIKEKLKFLGITPEELVTEINKNKYMTDDSIDEQNKLKIEIVDFGKGEFAIQSSILFNHPLNFISDIINKKISVINYINMQGIIYNIFILEGFDDKTAREKCEIVLYDNDFLTLQQRNEKLDKNIKARREANEDFTFYDVAPTDYDAKFHKITKIINQKFSIVRDKNIKYACDRLETFEKNIDDDIGFSIALIGLPFFKVPEEKKKELFNDIQNAVRKYIPSENKTE